MFRNIETESLVFGIDDAFYQKLDLSKRLWLGRIRRIPGIILNIPHHCWSFLKYVLICIQDIFHRHSNAVFLILLSASIFITSVILLEGEERMIIPMYCFSFICCSGICLFLKRGVVFFIFESSLEQFRHQRLIAEDREEADQPAGWGASQPMQRGLENVMEPRQGEGDSTIYCRYCCINGNAAGPSSAPECTCHANANSDEPSRGFFVARLHSDAINFFGPPDKIFGADCYRVLNDSGDEN